MQTCPELLLGPCKDFQCVGLLKCVRGLVSSQSPEVWGKQGQQLSGSLVCVLAGSAVDLTLLCIALVGGWWFSTCGHANLNGKYFRSIPRQRHERKQGIFWKTWKGRYYPLKSTTMKIQPTALEAEP